MKKAAILALVLGLAFSATAAEEKKDGEDAKKGGKPGTNVDMPYLMAPMTDADGKLTGYAYISSRLTAASESIVTDVREKLPFIQDAFVRDVNGAPVTGADPQTVDVPGVEARLRADAAKVLGAGKVKAIIVCTVQIAPLHPVQSSASLPPPGAKPPPSRCDS
jgi:hypothetical protein